MILNNGSQLQLSSLLFYQNNATNLRKIYFIFKTKLNIFRVHVYNQLSNCFVC